MKKSNFQFKNPILTQLEFELNNDFQIDTDEIEMSPTFNAKICKYSFNDFQTTVILQLEVGGYTDDKPFYIKVTMQSKFVWDANLNEDDLKNLLSQNAPSVLVSYLRPIIANITNASPFPAYNLPFVNFVDEQVTFEE